MHCDLIKNGLDCGLKTQQCQLTPGPMIKCVAGSLRRLNYFLIIVILDSGDINNVIQFVGNVMLIK